MMCDIDSILVDIFINSFMLLGFYIQKDNFLLSIHESLVDSRNVSAVAIIRGKTT